MAPEGDITRLLKSWGQGSVEAEERLMTLVYDELRRLAARQLRRERPGHTLRATALVNEAYLRLSRQARVPWKNRHQFYAIAAVFMRRILTDYFRHQHAKNHPPPELRMPLAEELPGDAGRAPDLVALDEALRRLAALAPKAVRVVELRFYCGLSLEETASVMGIAPITVRRHWTVAKVWLARELAARVAG
jgi:RNA polymerase sigma-70 factor (ECF subfamily)